MQILTTGAVAALLGVTEPRLNELVRRGKIAPAPTVRAGRRLWTEDDLRRAESAVECAKQLENDHTEAGRHAR